MIEKEDERLAPWWKRRLVAVVLTVGLTIFMVTALVLVICGG